MRNLSIAAGLLSIAAWSACGLAEDVPDGLKAWDGRRIKELTLQLRDDEYLRREDASRKLAQAPPGVLPIVERLAEDAEDPEVGRRLFAAARAIFQNRVVQLLPEWRKGRGFLGIRWSVLPNEAGVAISEVLPDTAADRAGLQNGDTILRANGQEFPAGMTQEEAMRFWHQMLPGDQLKISVKKAGKDAPVEMVVVVGSMPAEYQYEPTDLEKEERFWNRYREGRLHFPRELHGEPVDVEGKSLQSWPKMLQAPSKPTAP